MDKAPKSSLRWHLSLALGVVVLLVAGLAATATVIEISGRHRKSMTRITSAPTPKIQTISVVEIDRISPNRYVTRSTRSVS